MLVIRYTGRSPKPRRWPGPITGFPYAFGGHLIEYPIDARDARLMETGPFEIVDNGNYSSQANRRKNKTA